MFSARLKMLGFTPTNFNLYHYVGNNPVKYVDLDGMFFLFHIFSQKNKTYTRSMSHGCQIMNDSDFSDFRENLETLGFINGDSLNLRIR